MIHWLRTSAFRTAGMVLCVISSGVGDASQAQEPGGTLKPGEALVIVKVTGDVKALLFQRFKVTSRL